MGQLLALSKLLSFPAKTIQTPYEKNKDAPVKKLLFEVGEALTDHFQ